MRLRSFVITGVMFALAAWSGSGRERFIAVDEAGRTIATVTLEQPLPTHDTTFVFEDGEHTLTRPMTFETAGAFQCHWSDLVMICRSEAVTPPEARVDGGGYVRRLSSNTVLVAVERGGLSGDYSRYHDGRLVSFGVMDETGAIGWHYDLP
jgi:hypothetical protein